MLADPIHVGRVFQNLLGNALLYAGAAPPRVQISALREDREVRFAVRDRGIGIPASAHEAIFRAFQRLSGTEVPGSGLGLAICRKLVELHGGRIWVESRPGSGAAFYFTLAALDAALSGGGRVPVVPAVVVPVTVAPAGAPR